MRALNLIALAVLALTLPSLAQSSRLVADPTTQAEFLPATPPKNVDIDYPSGLPTPLPKER